MYFKVSCLAFQVQCPYLTCFGTLSLSLSQLVIIDIFEDWIREGEGKRKRLPRSYVPHVNKYCNGDASLPTVKCLSVALLRPTITPIKIFNRARDTCDVHICFHVNYFRRVDRLH